MGSNSDKSLSSPSLAAALELFPALSRQIEDLFEFDESFRGLCEDLADAANTLSQIASLPDDVREARRLEYQELLSSLCGEIEESLSKANVIHLRQDRQPPKP
jgi:hypothetical protein